MGARHLTTRLASWPPWSLLVSFSGMRSIFKRYLRLNCGYEGINAILMINGCKRPRGTTDGLAINGIVPSSGKGFDFLERIYDVRGELGLVHGKSTLECILHAASRLLLLHKGLAAPHLKHGPLYSIFLLCCFEDTTREGFFRRHAAITPRAQVVVLAGTCSIVAFSGTGTTRDEAIPTRSVWQGRTAC